MTHNEMVHGLCTQETIIKTSRENPRLQSWDERRQVK